MKTIIQGGAKFAIAIMLLVSAAYAQPTNLPSLIQAAEQTTPLSPESVPAIGTFYSAQNPNTPPTPSDALGLPAWNLGNGLWLLDDLNVDYSSFTPFGNMIQQPSVRMMAAMDSPPVPGIVGSGGGSSAYTPFVIPTNGLWLQITNVTTDTAYLDLNNATNQVYAIWSTTNFTNGSWQIETEIWPTNGVVMPFTISTFGRLNLFMMAEDWTGVTENGNTTPDWWFFYYFGQSAFPNGHLALSDTNLDAQGGRLLYDYNHGFDPNSVQFTISDYDLITNAVVANVSVAIQSGVPYFYAVVVDSTNLFSDMANASWIGFTSSNISVNLGADGTHTVWIGLRGLPSNSEQMWAETPVTVDTTPPIITVTSPSSVVSTPMIQIQGMANEELSRITYAVYNVGGILTNQTGYVIGRFYDTNLQSVTTNFFQCYDVNLSAGTNTITIRATDLAGNTTTTNFLVSLDYSGDTTPPVLTVFWPQDGAKISGNQFTVQAQVDDLTARVSATANGYTVQGVVQRNGQVRGLTLPLASGTNEVSVKATDAAGNSMTNTFSISPSSVTLYAQPISSNQLNQSSVNVSGTVSDPTEIVMINGVRASVNSDGTWTASGVLVGPSGIASLNASAYPSGSDPTSSPADGQALLNQMQPPVIRMASYQQRDTDNSSGQDLAIFWTYGVGGTKNDSGTVSDLATNDTEFYYNGQNDDSSGGNTWEFADYSRNDGSGEIESHYMNPRLVIDTGGEGVPGTSQSYLVSAVMWGQDWGTNIMRAPQEFKIQGQTLMDNGTTNSHGSYWGEVVVSAPAGATPDITPTPISQGAVTVPADWGVNGASGQDFLFAEQQTPITLQILDANTGAILTGQTTNVVVGQQVSLVCQSTASGLTASNFQWTVQGAAISNFIATQTSRLLKNSEII